MSEIKEKIIENMGILQILSRTFFGFPRKNFLLELTFMDKWFPWEKYCKGLVYFQSKFAICVRFYKIFGRKGSEFFDGGGGGLGFFPSKLIWTILFSSFTGFFNFFYYKG